MSPTAERLAAALEALNTALFDAAREGMEVKVSVRTNPRIGSYAPCPIVTLKPVSEG